jgi:hypothetical protein
LLARMAVVLELSELFGLKGTIYSIRAGIAYFRYKVMRLNVFCRLG